MMQNAISCWLWLLEHLSLDTVQLGTHFFSDTICIAFLQILVFNKPATEVFHRVLRVGCKLDLFLSTIRPNIGTTRMRIEQPYTQMHQHGSLTGEDMLNETTCYLIGHN